MVLFSDSFFVHAIHTVTLITTVRNSPIGTTLNNIVNREPISIVLAIGLLVPFESGCSAITVVLSAALGVCCKSIDLFGLYILFSQYRSCDNTQEVWSFVLFIKMRA